MKIAKELSAVTMWHINCYSGDAGFVYPYGITGITFSGLPVSGGETVRLYFHGISNLMQIIWRCCTEADGWVTNENVIFGSTNY